ncbi:aminoacyl-histidine dipeptidase [Gangjinia marincola]|uniref:Aminoacyl-histidine dipeptidase n=1 Tax=Gangjinia marincola TaxID=578463 RepID=A0ABN1MII7_9FLAO
MSQEVRSLSPKSIWKNFADLNAVPRPSKKEERVRQFMKTFGKSSGLETLEDNIGNIIIKKPATSGMEDRQTVVMQSHLDMVHQKNNDTTFDFDREGIQMYVDEDWVRAKGTTLGADNGLGVATIMAVLESKDLPHPAIEALFTIDEETGMTGAKELDESILSGSILLNLDTEEDDHIDIGCAGGVDVTVTHAYKEEKTASDDTFFTLSIKGLQGGHSGMDIHKGLGNANKLAARFLNIGIKHGIRLISFKGGSLRNAIPREAVVTFCLSAEANNEFQGEFEELKSAVQVEFNAIEPNLKIALLSTEAADKAMSISDSGKFIQALHAAHNGVFRMSPTIEDLVEASNNVARVTLKNGTLEIACLTRSSVDSTKWQVAEGLQAIFELAGYQVKFSGDYPGWAPNTDSAILDVVKRLYVQLNDGEEPHVGACHAGLECGIIGEHYPNLDMISFGPTIRGAHSPDERVSISSVQKFWTFVQEILKEIPKK